MKRLFLFIVLAIFIDSTVSSQPCLPDGITFTTQEQIDNFQSNYPNCTEIEGDVTISGGSITNLNGLSILTSIGEDLRIKYNDSLTSMVGLEGLTSIGYSFEIWRNDILGSLAGLQNLTSIGGSLEIGGWGGGDHFRYYGNPSLLDISDLGNLTSVGNSIEIIGNFSLESLTGLGNITSLNNLVISANDSLTDLSGINNLATLDGYLIIGYSHGEGIKGNKSLISLSALENLTSIGGALQIMGNAILANLTGLDNIDASSIDNLFIYDNPFLSTCEALSVCDYIADTSGYIVIHDNAPGCSSPEEVEEACDALTNVEINESKNYSLYPNPVTNFASFSSNEITFFDLYDMMGVLIISGKDNKVNMSNLSPGIYFVIGFDKNLHPLYKGKIVKK